MMSKTLQMTLAYQDGGSRNYTSLPTNQTLTANEARTQIQAINASLAGGTSGGLDTTFVSDEGGGLVKISGAKIVEETETIIFGGDF